ncbi:MAG: nitrous oxide reductase accessory protein NosL [Sulfurimonas sp.]|nr:nitrous oxide reductase accessory protein NosL [Sulfurimonas sp.]
MFKLVTLLILVLVLNLYASENKKFQTVSKEKATLLQKGTQKEACYRCGMNLIKFYKTSHASSIEGKDFQYCSIHCLADHLSKGLSLEDPRVVDIVSLEFIDIRAAYYVVGSKIRGTMSSVSKYAFLKESDAKDFQAKNSGEIMNFFDALGVAKKDFK